MLTSSPCSAGRATSRSTSAAGRRCSATWTASAPGRTSSRHSSPRGCRNSPSDSHRGPAWREGRRRFADTIGGKRLCTGGDAMATKLNKQLKREIDVEGKPFMVTLSPEGLKLTEKGQRLGRELPWKDLVRGAAAVAAAAQPPLR